MASEPADETELDNVAITKSRADEGTVNEENEGIPVKDSPEVEVPPPKISNESRHSIGSYNIPKDRKAGTSASLGVGGGRSNRPSQSENILAKSQSEMQVCTANSLSVSQTSKQSLMTFSSSGTFYDHGKKKADVRIPPKPVQASTIKDATDFRQMEQGLLQLLDDFHSGKLEAFGQNCTFEKMESVREQQEKLARLHFDLNAQQEMSGVTAENLDCLGWWCPSLSKRKVKGTWQHTDEGIKVAKGNLSKLMENLQVLSHSIEQLQTGCVGTEGNK